MLRGFRPFRDLVNVPEARIAGKLSEEPNETEE
jgi:hypothetical protein